MIHKQAEKLPKGPVSLGFEKRVLTIKKQKNPRKLSMGLREADKLITIFLLGDVLKSYEKDPMIEDKKSWARKSRFRSSLFKMLR